MSKGDVIFFCVMSFMGGGILFGLLVQSQAHGEISVLEEAHKREIEDLKQNTRLRQIECFYESQEKDNYWECMS